MKIAQMLESGGPGGAETVLLQLSDELRARGHEIVVIRCQDGETWLDEELGKRGIPVEYLPLARAVDPWAARTLEELLRRHEVEVAHSHEFTMTVYGAAACSRLGIPHIVTMHGNSTTNDALRRRVALRWAFRRSHSIVAVSDATRIDLGERLGRSAADVVTIPNGVPFREGKPLGPTQDFGIQPSEVVILAVGSAVPRKGHIILLRALAQIEEEGCEVPWRAIIAGRGEERPKLQAFADASAVGDRIHIAGHRDDIPDLQAAASVLCMPSLWEGLPLAILEAMHAGNCIVASATSGIPEAIRDDDNGLLVPPGDVDALASALRRVLEDPSLRARLGAVAKRDAQSRFSIDVMTSRYEELYRA
jgi:glycosyltransferase involved in cell wall biosynthesis